MRRRVAPMERSGAPMERRGAPGARRGAPGARRGTPGVASRGDSRRDSRTFSLLCREREGGEKNLEKRGTEGDDRRSGGKKGTIG